MIWTKPPWSEPMREFYIDGEDGWRIAKSYPGPVYTLSRRGKLVVSSKSLDELKEMADDQNCNAA